jgi:hypothetical protein
MDVVLDNAGLELYTDLLMADFLVTSGLASKVALHGKLLPWFVSDTLAGDMEAVLSALEGPTPAPGMEVGPRLFRGRGGALEAPRRAALLGRPAAAAPPRRGVTGALASARGSCPRPAPAPTDSPPPPRRRGARTRARLPRGPRPRHRSGARCSGSRGAGAATSKAAAGSTGTTPSGRRPSLTGGCRRCAGACARA